MKEQELKLMAKDESERQNLLIHQLVYTPDRKSIVDTAKVQSALDINSEHLLLCTEPQV